MVQRMAQSVLAMSLILLSACGGAASAPTNAPAPSVAPPTPTAPAAPTAMAAPSTPQVLSAGPLKDVPRNRTMVMAWWIGTNMGAISPLYWSLYNQQDGGNLMWEGLAYYGIFADKEIPWLAQSMTYTKPDFTELTIKLNPAAKWSDGVPVTARDVLFTFQELLDHDRLFNHADFQQFVQSMQSPDAQTVILTFKLPAPRFKFDVLTMHFDAGIPIVPAHALSQLADATTYAGSLDMPHSGPYNLVYWDDSRKVFDLRPDWWAVSAGLLPQPAVQRVIVVNTYYNNLDIDAHAQRVIDNEYDTTFDMRPDVIAEVVAKNPKVTTYAGRALPYGYMDWWTNSLWVNTQLAPYSDARVRRAMSLAINRPQIDATLFQGAPVSTIYPFPLYPALQRFVDSPAVKALEAKYQPGKFDLAESARLMTEAGFTKDADGLWEKDGKTVDATLEAMPELYQDLSPLLVEMLKAGGFDASADFGTLYQNAKDGKPGLYLFGHNGGVIDPYATFLVFNSRYSSPDLNGGSPNFSRYQNPAYDQIVDAMAPLSSDAPQFQALAAQALEIYWRDTIDIPVIQWIHRIPYNQTYWTNWPTKDNPELGINGSFWAQTGMLMVTGLKPAQ